MSMNERIVLAGFGGQGLLFAGKVIASAGLLEEKEVSWLPSYGPEMRGGTANCSVTVSTNPIGSPLVCDPTAIIAMNQPSLEKFESKLVSGGLALIDSTMVPVGISRTDIKSVAICATALAEKHNIKGLANIILVGRLWKEIQFCARETLDAAIDKCVPPRKAEMVQKNKLALELGINS